MTYEERTNAIGAWLRDVVLPRYSRPDHLADAEARAEVADMVQDINAEIPIMPAADFGPFLASVFGKLRRSYTARAWPPIGAFCKAIQAARKETVVKSTVSAPQDEYEIVAAKIACKAPVGQGYVYGPKAKELVARGLIEERDLQPYRSMLYFALREAYGDKAREMEARLIADHNAAPRPVSQQELDAVRQSRLKRMEG